MALTAAVCNEVNSITRLYMNVQQFSEIVVDSSRHWLVVVNSAKSQWIAVDSGR